MDVNLTLTLYLDLDLDLEAACLDRHQAPYSGRGCHLQPPTRVGPQGKSEPEGGAQGNTKGQ